MRPARIPTPSEIQLASVRMSGISATTTAITAAPSRSPSISRPARRSSRSGSAQATSSASAAPLAPTTTGTVSAAALSAVPPIPPIAEQHQHEPGAVAALEQPPEQGDRPDRGHREPGVAVDERRGQHPPPLAARLAEHDQVGRRAERRAPQDGPDQPERDEQQRGVRPCLGPDPGDLAAAQARQRRGARPAALADAALTVELGGPFAQPVAAVRAFGDVRAHLGPAALADDEQIGAARAHDPIVEPVPLPPARLHLRRADDLGHHLAQIVVGLPHHDLASRAVAPLEQVGDRVEVRG